MTSYAIRMINVPGGFGEKHKITLAARRLLCCDVNAENLLLSGVFAIHFTWIYDDVVAPVGIIEVLGLPDTQLWSMHSSHHLHLIFPFLLHLEIAMKSVEERRMPAQPSLIACLALGSSWWKNTRKRSDRKRVRVSLNRHAYELFLKRSSNDRASTLNSDACWLISCSRRFTPAFSSWPTTGEGAVLNTAFH